MKPMKGGKTIWVSFNKIPGGQVCTQHFYDLEGEKRQGEGEVHVEITAAEQVAAFKRQDDVCVNVNGKITKNEVLVWTGEDLSRNPNAALVVTEWAIKQGLAPIRAAADQKGDDPKTYEYDKRINALEGRIDAQDKKLDSILEAVGAKK